MLYREVKINLAKYMDERGISQAELAKSIGERRATIHDMYHGKTKRIPIDILGKVCTLLNIEVGELLTLEEAKKDEAEGGEGTNQ